ncbi:MAG: NADH-quinone oxidoreductase subunit J [Chloroflexota bacterium]
MSGSFIPLLIGCVIALACGVGVVAARRPVHAVVALLGHSLALAGLYLMLAADFVAIGQVLIYSGAIVVLFLFVVSLLPSGGVEAPIASGRVFAGVVAIVALAAVLIAAGVFAVSAVSPGPSGLHVAGIGRSLFGRLIVPFELTAPLLLVAIIGAVAVWRRQEPLREEPRRGPRQ